MTADARFADRLAAAVRSAGNPVCVGLDPRWAMLPDEIRGRHEDAPEGRAAAYEAFCLEVIALVAGKVPVVKPQSAFFEACGAAGFAALEAVIRFARNRGLLTILDAKRGDVAGTAAAYAEAAFDALGADALTVNPYLGGDALTPLLERCEADGRGLFVLVRTSNPAAGLFQDLRTDDRPLYEHVGDAVAEWNAGRVGGCGFGDVGAVVGATHPRELAALRQRLPGVWFLVPGYGAQGGSAADVRAAFREDGLGAVVNSSRGLTFPYRPDDADWRQKIVAAVDQMAGELRP